MDQAPTGSVLETEFVRHRNVLLVRGVLTELFVDYYLHLADQGVRLDPEVDRLLKEGLAAAVLHAASRPHQEIIAWTVNFQSPLVNLFLSGDNEDFTVVGRAFTENVRVTPQQLVFADVVRARGQPRRSAVDFSGSTAFAAVEALYRQSEQRPARFLQLGGDAFALVAQHPDCDEAWYERAVGGDLLELLAAETVVPIERRLYRWSCGCSIERLMRVLAPQMRADADGLFLGDETLQVHCPRCAARYVLTREAMEAWLSEHPA